MKIVIEAQHAVQNEYPRGVGYYSIQLIKALLLRKKFDYALTFFDYNGQNSNRARAEKHFGRFNIPFHECAELDYRAAIRDEGVYEIKSYNGYTGSHGDIFHFTNYITIPTKLSGKLLTTVHDLNWIPYEEGTSEQLRPLLKISFDRMARLKPIIIACSQSAKSEILKYSDIPAENIHVVYQSYDEEGLFPDKENIKNIKPLFDDSFEYLFFVGTFERKKNIVRIVKAFEQIAGSFKDLRLVLAGKPTWDDPEPIYRVIKESPYNGRIITPGYIDADAKRLLYSNALCLVFPSICEGFGIPVLEAFACGCPVITADNTSLPEVGGSAAIYVNALQTQQLAHEMRRVADSQSLRDELRQKGFEQCKKFSWDKTAERVESVYAGMI